MPLNPSSVRHQPSLQNTFSFIRQNIVILLASIICALIVGVQVLRQPIIGLADNGDFIRIMSDFGLEHTTDDYPYFDYLQRVYHINQNNIQNWQYLTSEKIIISPIVKFVDGVLQQDLLDIRVVGAVHAFLYWMTITLLLFLFRRRHIILQAVFSLAIVLIFSDVTYIQFFNSFYSEPMGIIFFLLSVFLIALIAIEDLPPARRAAVYGLLAISVSLFFTAKPQYAPLGAVLGLWIFYLSLKENGHLWILYGAALCAVIGSASYFYLINATPDSIDRANRYNAIFLGLLHNSPDPAQDLREIGIEGVDPLIRYTGLSYWDPGVRTVLDAQPDLEEKIVYAGYSSVLDFYLRHPERLVSLAWDVSAHAFETNIHYLGNFEKEASLPERQRSERFNTWTKIRKKIFPRTEWFFISFVIINVVSAVAYRIHFSKNSRKYLIADFHLLLLLLALIEFALVVVGEGMADPVKQLFIANLFVDLMVLCIIFYAVSLFQLLSASISQIQNNQ